MRSFVRLALAATAAAPLCAQTTEPVSPALAAAVTTAIAARWTVGRERIALAWGVAGARLPAGPVPFRLAGGAGGWFAVIVEPPGGAPVAARVRATVRDSVLEAARALDSGTVLTAADVRMVEHAVVPSDHPDAPAEAGWIVRMSVAAGTALTARVAEPPPAVRARDKVHLVWRVGTVRVTTEGIALHDAPLGGSVRVRDALGRSGLRGTVTSPTDITMTP